MNVKEITPGGFTGTASPERVNGGYLVIFLVIPQLLRRAVMKAALKVGRITLTITLAGRRVPCQNSHNCSELVFSVPVRLLSGTH